MKTRQQFAKWGKVALAGLCALLVFKLVSEIKGNPSPADDPDLTVSRPPSKPATPVKSESRQGNASVKLDHTLQLQALEEFVTRALPDITRNPFDFGPPPLTPAQRAAQAASGAAMKSSAAASPSLPLRAIGYSERTGVGPEAYLTDSDQVYVVHDGDVISQRYKIVRITSLIVEVRDGVSGERVQLPIPLVQ
jgi:hypothetical protein